MSGREIWFAITHSGTGGAHLVTLSVARAFEARGYRVTVVALFPSTQDRPALLADQRWTHVAERRPRGPAAFAGMLAGLVRLIRQRRPVAIFSALPAANALFPFAAFLAGGHTRCISIHHTEVSTHSSVSRLLDRLIGPSRAIHRIVCVSNAVRQSLAGRSARYRRKTMMIHNALDSSVSATIRALAAERRASHRPGRLVVATGRLAMQKNYATLLRAFADVDDARLMIIGKGPEAEALQALADELGLGERVSFLGFRPHEETLRLLAGADLFVQPSLFEGHSMALLEAALMGLPVIVSDTPAQREAMTRSDGVLCAELVPATDAAALARSITRILDDGAEAARLARLARSCGEEYAFERMIAAYAALIDDEGPDAGAPAMVPSAMAQR